MLTKRHGYLTPRQEAAPEASRQIEEEGFAVLEGALKDEVEALTVEIEEIYERYGSDGRSRQRPRAEDEDFRYEMLNRSAACQRVVGHRAILDVIEPLLGEDCHVIANTCWRNPPREANRQGGANWHIDAGPHIPRDSAVAWPEDIPYPIFAIGLHIFLIDCPAACGPTGVIPGSHKSGRHPPFDRSTDEDLTWGGQGVVPLVASAGDVALFASDVWHRRLPSTEDDTGRFFLQVHYGRRDIAQRVRTTTLVNHLSEEAISRAKDRRDRTVIGLHTPGFYDG